MQDGKVLIDQTQLMMYGLVALIVIVLIIVVTVAMKRRKKDFIKTVPTNLKEDE